MDVTQKLVLAMAAWLIVIMLPGIISPKRFRELMMDLMSDTKILRVLGFMTMCIGFVYLSVYSKISGGWLMIISILGYAAVIKGIWLLWLPETAKPLFKRFFNTDMFYIIAGIIAMLIAIGLIYVALYPLAPVVIY